MYTSNLAKSKRSKGFESIFYINHNFSPRWYTFSSSSSRLHNCRYFKQYIFIVYSIGINRIAWKLTSTFQTNFVLMKKWQKSKNTPYANFFFSCRIHQRAGCIGEEEEVSGLHSWFFLCRRKASVSQHAEIQPTMTKNIPCADMYFNAEGSRRPSISGKAADL